MDLSPEGQIKLIESYLQEVIKPEIIRDVILNQKRPLKIYWGMLFGCIAPPPQLTAGF